MAKCPPSSFSNKAMLEHLEDITTGKIKVKNLGKKGLDSARNRKDELVMTTNAPLTFCCPECDTEQSIDSNPLTWTRCANCLIALRVDQRTNPWTVITIEQLSEQLETDNSSDVLALDTIEKVEAYYKQLAERAVEDHRKKEVELDHDLEKELRGLEDQKLATLRTLEGLVNPMKYRESEN